MVKTTLLGARASWRSPFFFRKNLDVGIQLSCAHIVSISLAPWEIMGQNVVLSLG